VADGLVVVARTSGAENDRRGITLFLVRKGAPGLEITRQWRVDSRNAALVKLAGVAVGPSEVIGAVDEGGELFEKVVDRAMVGLCSEMLGSMEEAAASTFKYLKTRVQFGVPIGSFQALKHRAARMYIELELSRSTLMAAARAVDEDHPELAKLASLAKARCSDAGILIANEAVQMHGGVGMTDEYDVGFYLKRARVAEITFGDATHHRERWARLSGY
jgi:alkylation response protein AidB-like acyl-CoA dehydrogenase